MSNVFERVADMIDASIAEDAPFDLRGLTFRELVAIYIAMEDMPIVAVAHPELILLCRERIATMLRGEDPDAKAVD